MKLKVGFFCLLCLIACSPGLLNLASEYQNNILNLDKLQKEFRKELSYCDYDKKCFEERIKDYIEKQVCVAPDYKKYGFVSIQECDKACFTLADQVKNFQNFGGDSPCKEELAKIYDLEDDLDKVERDLDEAKKDLEKAEIDYKTVEGDKDNEEKRAWEDYQEAREDYQEARDDFKDDQRDFNKYVREYKKCLAGIK